LVNAHRPTIAQSISSGSVKPRMRRERAPEKASASSEAIVVVQATVAVAVCAMRSRRAPSESSN